MPTGLLLILDAPQRFKATYCNGEIYVAEVEQDGTADSANELIGTYGGSAVYCA